MSAKPRLQKRTMAILAVSGFVLLVTTLVAAYYPVSRTEVALFQAIYKVDVPFLQSVAYGITQAGSLTAVAAAGAIAVYTRKRKLALQLMASGLVAYVCAGALKLIVLRPRPWIVEGVASRYETAAGNGFPSGHTAIVTALAITLWLVAPQKYRPFLIAWIVLVGLSRIYLGVHFPLDIIGGFCIGFMTAVSMQFGLTKLLPRTKN